MTMRPTKEKEKDKGDPEWSELICKTDPANVGGGYCKCVGPKCGHWNVHVGMCGFAAIGEIVHLLSIPSVHTLNVPKIQTRVPPIRESTTQTKIQLKKEEEEE